MQKQITMPKLGLTMEEAQLVTWEKNVGDWVEKNDVIATVETDKAVLEVEAVEAGYLVEQVACIGEIIVVGGIMAYLQDTLVTGEKRIADVPDFTLNQPSLVDQGMASRIRASPAARKLANENGISLETVRGRGPHGRIVLKDIISSITEVEKLPSSASTISEQIAPSQVKKPLSGMRKTIAQRLTLSFRDIPQFQVKRFADMTHVIKLRETLVSSIEKSIGIRLSITDFMIQAVAQAIKEVPKVNVSYVTEIAGDYIVEHAAVNIGLAVALDEGLVVPVIRNADQLSLIEIAKQRHRLVMNSQRGSLMPEDYSKGTFTISSLAVYEVDEFVALINPPEAGILAIGKIEKKAIVKEDAIRILPMICLNGSFDHRALDGADGAKFMHKLVERLESDEWLIF
mgnify:CR=1 FL=1